MAKAEPDAGDIDEAEKAVCGFAVAGRQSAKVHGFVKPSFDPLAHLTVIAHWDHGRA